jgi:hypothetical protein
MPCLKIPVRLEIRICAWKDDGQANCDGSSTMSDGKATIRGFSVAEADLVLKIRQGISLSSHPATYVQGFTTKGRSSNTFLECPTPSLLGPTLENVSCRQALHISTFLNIAEPVAPRGEGKYVPCMPSAGPRRLRHRNIMKEPMPAKRKNRVRR